MTGNKFPESEGHKPKFYKIFGITLTLSFL